MLFQSKDITIHDVYPNPVQDHAFIDYQLHNENVKAKLVIHNILGRPLDEYELNSSETRAKIQTEEYTSGIYFYTLYLDNNGILTRKLIIRK
ncbi:MAG: T9SS type A sorting domain-containing protein [Flammeovirgaceae bacterium]|nr:T9SS type A sorting domain-containing protein [Flammeovirgaceae bacterium]